MATSLLSDAALLQLAQEGLLEKPVKKGIVGKEGVFRGEFVPVEENMDVQPGLSYWETATGEVNAVGQALDLTSDVTKSTLDRYEQWFYDVIRTGDQVQLHANEAKFLLKSFDQKMTELGQSINLSLGVKARDALYNSALAGHSFVASNSSGTTLTLDHINGFTRNLSDYRYDLISTDNPLELYILSGSDWLTATAVGYSATSKTLTLTGSVTVEAGWPVVSETASKMIFANSTAKSTEDLIATDTMTWADVDNAVFALREAGVEPHSDGYYWCYLSAKQMQAVKNSTEVRNSFLGMGVEGMYNPYLTGMVYVYEGVKFIVADVPQYKGNFISNIKADASNSANVKLGYAIVTGADGFKEKQVYVPESLASGGLVLVPGASISGVVDGCNVVIKDGADSFNKLVKFSWEYMGAFVCRTDFLSKEIAAYDDIDGNAGYKRAVVIASAI